MAPWSCDGNTSSAHPGRSIQRFVHEAIRAGPQPLTGRAGYLIPKDSTVLSNAWCAYILSCRCALADVARHRHMTRHTSDGRPIDQPDDFIPERFLDARAKDLPDPSEIVFGFGRRFVESGIRRSFARPADCRQGVPGAIRRGGDHLLHDLQHACDIQDLKTY